jgi:hypothetical protein
MTVKQLIHALSRPDVDPEAEVIISAPLCLSRAPGNDPERKDSLDLPVRCVETGNFVVQSETGEPWAMIIGTDVWGVCDNKLTERSIRGG